MQLTLALSALLTSTAAVPAADYHGGWAISAQPVQPREQITITFVVKERGAEEVRRIAGEVSDPASPSYGEFLTTDELMALTAPAAEDMTAVTGWLEANGIGYQTRHSNLIADMSVEAASKLFSTNFHTAEHAGDGRSLIRAADYSVPAEVEGSLQTIFGLHGLPLPAKHAVVIQSHDPPYPDVPVTPDVLASTYGIGGVKVSGSIKNRQAVAEFQGQYMNSTDLKVYFKKEVDTYAKGIDDTIYKFVGKHTENSNGIEAELDIQFIMGPAAGIKTEFWEFPDNNFGSDLNEWSSNLTSGSDMPLVHSVSYGWQGNLSAIQVTQSDVDTVDSNFQKMAALGMSVMISSGDSGSGYTNPSTPGGDQCRDTQQGKRVGIEGVVLRSSSSSSAEDCCDQNSLLQGKGWTFVGHLFQPLKDSCTIYSSVQKKTIARRGTVSGTTEGSPTGPVLWPSWPASSPYVTAVGATRFIGQKVGNGEMASDQFGSGGGFSQQFDQTNAKWQVAATAKYLSTVEPSTLPPAGSFPPTGRGTPDVSALGEGYQVIVNGHPVSVGGTSASSPAFASMVSLLNEARLNAGKKPMGLLNPFLYANPGAFTDVTEGSNKVGRGGKKLAFGYNCSVGWDPATGLGTPLFPKLLAAAMK